jgi:hypothetical protein
MQEVESVLLECLEKGVTVERDVLNNIKAVLPPDAANALSTVSRTLYKGPLTTGQARPSIS